MKKGFWYQFFTFFDGCTGHNANREQKFWEDARKHEDRLWHHANENAGKAPGTGACGTGSGSNSFMSGGI